MNAYELADELKKCIDDGSTDLVCVCSAVNMIRQQADRIAELEKCLFQMQNACIDLTEQSAEPVAWIDPKELDMDVSTTVTKNKQFDTDIPLYTTPQIKELSDEEIDLKWWISSFEHLKALGGGISDEMEAKLKEMKERLKKASEK